jgi:hypothetical protein
MKTPAFVLAVLLWATAAGAQTCEVNCEISQAQTFTVFTEADTLATSYAVFANGAQIPLAAKVVNGFVEFTFASGLNRGTYQFVIIAYDGAAEAWRTDPNTLTVKPGKRVIKFR